MKEEYKIEITERVYAPEFPEGSKDGLVNILESFGYSKMSVRHPLGYHYYNKEEGIVARIIPVGDKSYDGILAKFGFVRPFIAIASSKGYRLSMNKSPGEELDRAIHSYFHSLPKEDQE